MPERISAALVPPVLLRPLLPTLNPLVPPVPWIEAAEPKGLLEPPPMDPGEPELAVPPWALFAEVAVSSAVVPPLACRSV